MQCNHAGIQGVVLGIKIQFVSFFCLSAEHKSEIANKHNDRKNLLRISFGIIEFTYFTPASFLHVILVACIVFFDMQSSLFENLINTI